MIVIGLTGSVGMGKSTTAGLFAEEGVPVFDADRAVHDLYRSDAVPLVETAFPGVARNGTIDRTALGERVVGDAEAMQRLEAIVHPLVRQRRQVFLTASQSGGAAMAVLDIPLLYETGSETEVDVVVVVSAPETVQKARVLERPGMTEQRFAAIVAKQMPDAEKRRRADFVIETGGGLKAAARQVRDLVSALRNRQAS